MSQTPQCQIKATYRIVTPAFVGGAENESVAELRLPSIKGALRFWWRTVAWARLGNDVVALRNDEAALFGSAGGEGQSRVILRLSRERTPSRRAFSVGDQLDASGRQIPGAAYLGYGLMHAAQTRAGNKPGQLTRPALSHDDVFSVVVRFRNGLPPTLRNEFIQAMVLLGSVGGIGSRSRRGWGSLSLVELEGAEVPGGTAVQDRLGHLLKTCATRPYDAADAPLWTAWSDMSRVLIVRLRSGAESSMTDPLDLLDRIGTEMVQYRSWGSTRHGGQTIVRLPAERNFRADHDLMKLPARSRDAHPERIAFGLPHNYGQGESAAVGPRAGGALADCGIDRRASPLFIHVHQVTPKEHPAAIVSFLPSRFLPAGASVNVGGAVVPVTTALNKNGEEMLWGPLHRFMDRLKQSDKFQTIEVG